MRLVVAWLVGVKVGISLVISGIEVYESVMRVDAPDFYVLEVCLAVVAVKFNAAQFVVGRVV